MNLKIRKYSSAAVLILLIISSCIKYSGEEKMLLILKDRSKKFFNHANNFSPEAKLIYYDSLSKTPSAVSDHIQYNYSKADAFLELGIPDSAIEILQELLKVDKVQSSIFDVRTRERLALAYLRIGEQTNCTANHNVESCVFPISGGGIHKIPMGSRKASALYEALLKENASDLESIWLLNISYMTLGEYPGNVPLSMLIPIAAHDTVHKVKAFENIASDLDLDIKNMAGGVIVEDFNNDGYLDIATSAWGLEEAMHYFKNNADGTFIDLSQESGLKKFTGGLNMMQTDYNNDGYKDIFVTRGGWQMKFGEQPNSLLKNNGNGTFTDVTIDCGLLSFHPTQTATWNDFNNDGWLDVFIGNETDPSFNSDIKIHPCELYMNNQNGTFTEVALKAHCGLTAYVKGVTSGDYDNDGWKDLFISSVSGGRVLLKNKGIVDGIVRFEDVTKKALLDQDYNRTFPTWFWDYNNDGWLDILVGDYTFQKSLAYYAAAEGLKIPVENTGQPILYKNNKNGTFTNVTKEMGLFKTTFAMGSNFGDIDNDGFLDMYLGTGNPSYKSLVPNKMFKNIGGKAFADVTTSAKVGNLQKGHGVAFGDMDNDGDQDIYIDMGGAFIGDAYPNSFYLNPGQSDNNWICLQLEGAKTNRSAIGTRVKVTFKEDGIARSVYRDVNSGGSFGASPLRREIGLGKAKIIDEIEILWHGTGKTQTFKNILPNQFIKITEGKGSIEKIKLKQLAFKRKASHQHNCMVKTAALN